MAKALSKTISTRYSDWQSNGRGSDRQGNDANGPRFGLSREQLYRSFSDQGNPTLKTILSVVRALGVDLTARPHYEEPAA